MARPLVVIDDLLVFDSADVVLLPAAKAALQERPQALLSAIGTAYAHQQNPLLIEACSGGTGPLAGLRELTLDQFQTLIAAYAEDARRNSGQREARSSAIRQRRAQFGFRRPDLVLAMLDAGVAYVCARPGCGVAHALTVDHIRPLSRGGSDDLSNLQFLCVSHNSAKRDRI